MLSTLVRGILVSFVVWALWRFTRLLIVKSPLSNLPGPRPKSRWRGRPQKFLTLHQLTWFPALGIGNLPQLFNRHSWGFLDNIDKQGRAVVRITAMFNKPALYVYDPKALHHVILKDQQVFERSSAGLAFTRITFGHGLLGTVGERHRQQRKMLNPVFSINHMRHMTPIFYQTIHRLEKAVSDQLGSSSSTEVDMLNWMGRTALELVGQGGLGYSFDPLVANTHNSFGEALKAFLPTFGRCARYRFLAHYVTNLGSASFRRRVVELWPDANIQDFKNIVDTMEMRSKDILESKRAALRAGDEAVKEQIGEGKDIMSILLRSNMSTESEDRLTEEELVAQMSTLVFAATDTTSNALSRILHLLTIHQDVQDKMRAEILEAGQGRDIPYDQLIDLPYLDAVCRETLRLYSPVSILSREARQDTILPFSEPVEGLDGTMMHEVVVPKGTLVFVAIRACNRNKAIWGEDALEWKPERWLSPLPSAVKEANIPGVYSNLMTFLGGGKSCIGFKFSQLEMKVALAVLLSNFKFSATDKEVYWNFAGVSYPTVGPDARKAAMPLTVERIRD